MILFVACALAYGLGTGILGWVIGRSMANANKAPSRTMVRYYAPAYRDFAEEHEDR